MLGMNERLTALQQQLGLHLPDILLPAEDVDLTKWAVIACDQYSSEPDYWQRVSKQIEGVPSTGHLILPEVYLDLETEAQLDARIRKINQNMTNYLDNCVLEASDVVMILVDRATRLHPSRKGLVLAIDLECYDYEPGSQNLIRASEATVKERIPPRLKIRDQALLELPHVLLLIDNPDCSVVEPAWQTLRKQQPLYEAELMQGGGHVTAYGITRESPELPRIIRALASLKSYQEDGLLFAVGDGNHSLATAKQHWENLKAAGCYDHPARYTLVEVVNLYDHGLAFAPIHRILFGSDLCHFLNFVTCWREQKVRQLGEDHVPVPNDILRVYTGGIQTRIRIPRLYPLTVAAVQEMLDDYLAHPDTPAAARLDYIHDTRSLLQLSADGGIGIELQTMDKHDFFAYLCKEGVMPRKSFSLGESFEKRYYFECRQII